MARGERKSPGITGAWAEMGTFGNEGYGPLASALPIEQYLAAIVAHELSNPFTAMAGRVDLIRNRKDLSAPLGRDLESMRSAGERIERILANLKTFSRRDTPPPRPVELLPIAQAAVEKFRNSPAAVNVETRLVLWDGSVRALADPALLESVLAATLEVLAERDPKMTVMTLRLTKNAADEEVSLIFQDNGRPPSEEEMARVFHPFGGEQLCPWKGAIILAYGYYVVRAWGGTYRFWSEEGNAATELCLALQV